MSRVKVRDTIRVKVRVNVRDTIRVEGVPRVKPNVTSQSQS